MENMVQMVADKGLSLVIVALFLYDWITNKKTNSETLKEISDSNKNIAKSNENIAKSLDIIQNNQLSLEHKVDRNYEEIVRCENK